ncbi:MAG: hypothetical protein FJ149_03060 [Euryarchaeota archaeon]|nr:hypothetical protein [Euryarchaeota archaeon]
MKAPERASPERPGKAEAVDRYIAALPPDRRAAIGRLRRTIRAAAPLASGKMGCYMPNPLHA